MLKEIIYVVKMEDSIWLSIHISFRLYSILFILFDIQIKLSPPNKNVNLKRRKGRKKKRGLTSYFLLTNVLLEQTWQKCKIYIYHNYKKIHRSIEASKRIMRCIWLWKFRVSIKYHSRCLLKLQYFLKANGFVNAF